MKDVNLQLAIESFKSGATIDECRKLCDLSRNRMIAELKRSLGLENYTKIAKSTSQRKRKEGSHKSHLGVKRGPMSTEVKRKISESHKGKALSEDHRRQISESIQNKLQVEGFWLSKEQIQEKNLKSAVTSKERGSHRKGQHSEALLGHTHTLETKKRMSEAKQRFFEKGGMPSFLGKRHKDQTKSDLSKRTLRMWEDGKFDFKIDNSVWKSKLEMKVFDKLSEAFDCKSNFRIRNFVYDIYVKDLNLLIEVNGDYWHFNPRKYDSDHFDKYRQVHAKDVWQRDHHKMELARSSGYNFECLWQEDLNLDFEGCVLHVINKYRSVHR